MIQCRVFIRSHHADTAKCLLMIRRFAGEFVQCQIAAAFVQALKLSLNVCTWCVFVLTTFALRMREYAALITTYVPTQAGRCDLLLGNLICRNYLK